MLPDELDVGPYRIYAAAIDSPGGYAAAAAVYRRDQAGMREAWRDLDLGAGQRWECSEDALSFAIQRARELLFLVSVLSSEDGLYCPAAATPYKGSVTPGMRPSLQVIALAAAFATGSGSAPGNTHIVA